MILFRKMLREMRSNFGQFFSIFLLSMIAVMVYLGFNGDVIGFRISLADFNRKTNAADAWLYGEGFTEEDLKAVRALPFVEAAQFRTELTGSAPDYDDAQTDIYLQKEALVTVPLVLEGAAYDPEDTNGLWLNSSFANARGIRPGDSFTVSYGSEEITLPVRGLIMTPEYIYTCADNDADTNLANLAYVYMNYDAFPAMKYLLHTVMNGNLSFEGGFLDSVSDDGSGGLLPYTEILLTANDGADIMTHEEEIAAAVDNNYAVLADRSMILGIQRFLSELDQHETFSYTFALAFVIMAVLIISTTMSRMVKRQRTQIGTLNAIGMNMKRVAFHYVSYSLVLSLLGSAAGFFIGLYGFAHFMVSIFADYYVLPAAEPAFDASSVAVIFIVALICTLSSYFSCRRLLKVAPAEALRPEAPKNAKRILAERLPFWNRLGFVTQYNLRDLARAKLRAVMGIFGTAFGMILAVFSFGCLCLMDDTADWIFTRIQNYDYQVVLSDDVNLNDADAMSSSLHGELVMADAIELSTVRAHATSSEKSTQTLTVIEGKGLYNVTDAHTNITHLTPGKIAITYRLANKLGVGIGDTVYWHLYSENDWYSSTVGSICRAPETSGISMLREDFEKTGAAYHPTMLVTDDANAVNFKKDDAVSAVFDTGLLRETFMESWQSIYLLIYFMLFFSALMIIIVLYNAGNISFNERFKEFATLKVMGLSTQKIRAILNTENIWLTVIGILAGCPFAMPMLEVMMNSNGDNFDYYMYIPPIYYVISGIFVLAVAFLVGFLFSKKIRTLDMVDSLKGAE